MHELALAQQILHIVVKTSEEYNFLTVSKIKIKAGELLAVVPEALEFSFKIISQNTVAENAQLIVQQEQAIAQCQHCSLEYPWLKYGYQCPSCKKQGGTIIRGRDLTIDYLEGD